MRLVGILLILAGLFFAIAKPWFQSNFTGEEIANFAFFEKNQGDNSSEFWNVSERALSQENNPHRIRINVKRLPGQKYQNGKLKLLVRIAPLASDGSTQEAAFAETITINLENATDNPPDSAAQLISTSTGVFNIPQSGNYKIGAIPLPSNAKKVIVPDFKIDPNVVSIRSIVQGRVEETSSLSAIKGFAMVIFGIVLVSMSGRRKRRKRAGRQRRNAPARAPENTIETHDTPVSRQERAPPPKPPEPKPAPKPVRKTNVGKTSRWGRNAGKKK